VSAVVLTIGEPSTERAIQSLRVQTLPPKETIVIRDLRPFHRALNAGAARVSTPFFVQVDADMVLDPDCIATLRSAVREHTGQVFAHLRDPLVGEVVGIKLYRTSCFTAGGLPDSISPDVDLGLRIVRSGYKSIELGVSKVNRWKRPTTVGAHDPRYTPEYTYAKHLMLGRRYRYNRDLAGILWNLGRLEASAHPLALLSEIGLANGIFLEATNDLLGIINPAKETQALIDFFASRGSARSRQLSLRAPGEEIFEAGYRLGDALFHSGAASSFKRAVEELNPTRWSAKAWIAKVGIYRGSIAGDLDPARIRTEYSILRDFLATADARLKAEQQLRGLVVPLLRTFARARRKVPADNDGR
jgi:hypothetical protein